MTTNSIPDKYLTIDQDGFVIFDGNRLESKEEGLILLQNMRPREGFGTRIETEFQGVRAIIEAFDTPLIIQRVELNSSNTEELKLTANYDFKTTVQLQNLYLDEWDRFRGYTEQGIPFVFTRPAQAMFFNLCDEFTDETVTINGSEYTPKTWLAPNTEVSDELFWSSRYQKESTPWDMERPHPALASVLPQLKLNKQRILVLGCGSAHDAAFLADAGHIVTAVDFSKAAIEKAQTKFGDRANLKFFHGDAFQLPETFQGQYDLVFEHTFQCAINPEKRNDLVKVWNRCLHREGYLLGLFFVFDRPGGPPFGGSEWEIKSRLDPYFDFLYWTRWRRSEDERQGSELIVYGQRKARNE
ncbi:MAG: hypothetical protein CL677_04340 [Bdellovibrionaceae bacterium]|nr:hypothetical protein [Pseudobdellovibrionaceae bacterium]|tara:strand:- start:43031 stop:44098 length:1068 start_codon:yes stop_codon:yes gene_type:complete